ncbi:MAG: hypothetical protein AABZ39_04900 [Spirochaetota bacterium]
MSAYIVNDNVINRIVAMLWADAAGGDRYLSHPIKRLGYDVPSNPKLLARHMHNLNRFAIWERYLHREPYSHQFKDMWADDRYQTLVDLQCFLYQCSEGRADQSHLFKALYDVKQTLMLVLLRETDAFQKTIWNKE